MGIGQTGVRRQKTVGERISTNIPQENLLFHNFRLNDHGVNITKRMKSDNSRTILSSFGMQWGRSMGHVKEYSEKGKIKTQINTLGLERASTIKVAQLIDISQYHPHIRVLYGEMDMTRRSNFISDKFWEGIGGYGVNKNFEINWTIEKSVIAYLNERYFDYFAADEFDFDLREFVESGRWLTHVKTGVNSGYPYNAAQEKRSGTIDRKATVAAWDHRDSYYKIMDKYFKGEKIDWFKFPFEMGMRTERNDSIRVIMQAPFFDKISAAIVNTIFDDHKYDIPLSIPRKYGSFDNLAKKIMSTSGSIFCKDFKKFDRFVPIHLVKIIRTWFGAINTTFAKLMCFELDLLINSMLILEPGVALKVNSIPSGIGITQFIGSLIHECIDDACGLDALFKVYQSDDTLAVTTMDETECKKFMEDVTANFGMPISPIGEKSLFSDSVGILLQKVIDKDKGIYYNHEPRAFNNGIFRERFYNVGEEFKVFVGEKDPKKALKKNAILSYLGNLSSYGFNAPSLPYIWSFMLGKRSGFTKSQITWGLNAFESYDKFIKNAEQHRPMEPIGWFVQSIEHLLGRGWGSYSPADVRNSLEGILV